MYKLQYIIFWVIADTQENYKNIRIAQDWLLLQFDIWFLSETSHCFWWVYIFNDQYFGMNVLIFILIVIVVIVVTGLYFEKLNFKSASIVWLPIVCNHILLFYLYSVEYPYHNPTRRANQGLINYYIYPEIFRFRTVSNLRQNGHSKFFLFPIFCTSFFIKTLSTSLHMYHVDPSNHSGAVTKYA